MTSGIFLVRRVSRLWTIRPAGTIFGLEIVPRGVLGFAYSTVGAP